jgi:aldehyde dehydrogenase (NAD+)
LNTVYHLQSSRTVVALIKANSLQDAIKIANNIEYGLSSSIFTQNINNAETAARDLQAGLVYVNTSTIGAEIQTPFGGLKGTGNAHREAGGHGGAIETYTELKIISVDYSGKIQKAQID